MYESFYESFKKDNNIISVYFKEKVKGAQLNYFFFLFFFSIDGRSAPTRIN